MCQHVVTARVVNLDTENLAAFTNLGEPSALLDFNGSSKNGNFGLDELQNQFHFKMHLRKILFEQSYCSCDTFLILLNYAVLDQALNSI